MPDGSLQVRSGMIGWIIDDDGAIIADPDLKEQRAREVWRVYVGGKELDKQFILQTLNDWEGKVHVLNRYESILDGNLVIISVTYIIHDGKPAERAVQINGVSDELKSQIRIEREWHDIDTDEVLYATSESESKDSVALSRKSITPDESGEYVRLMKEGKLVIHENLRTAGQKLQNIEYDTALVKFSYSGWSAGTTVKLTDDTYSTNSGTFNHVQTSSGTGSSCPSPSTTGTNPSPVLTSLGASGSSTFCRLMFFDWGVDFDIVPANATVSSTTFKFQVSTSSNAINCDVVALTSNRPAISSASTVWNDIVGGSAYVSNNDFCTTTGTNKSLTLGSTANSDVQNRAEEWFAIGIRFIDMTRDSTARVAGVTAIAGTPSPTLEILYTVPQSYDRTPGDTVTFSDSIAVILVAARSGADSWITSESIARIYHSFRAIAETATITDSASRKLTGYRSPSDSAALTDSISANYSSLRSTSDALGVLDSISYTVSASRPLADSLSMVDSIDVLYTEAVEQPIILIFGAILAIIIGIGAAGRAYARRTIR